MTRSDFIKKCTVLGLGAPFLATLFSSCDREDVFANKINTSFNGKVLIIGAGSAGLIAGHILRQLNIDFQILEASSVFGGRVKRDQDLADFPIDLGAEWIHTNPSILADLLNEPDTQTDIDIITYRPEELYFWKNNKLRKGNFFSNFYSEYKFKNTTWYGFFDEYIVPHFSDKIVYNSPVKTINYTADKVVVTNTRNENFEADKVLVTVPINILKNNSIDFQPSLPNDKINALDTIEMPDGIKVFIEFSEKFYPDLIYDGGLGALLGDSEGEKVFYDAAFRKDATRHVLGLFTVGPQASVYTNLETDAAIIEYLMEELDGMFDGKASQFYLDHVIQNWSKEPFIQGSYSHFQGAYNEAIQTLLRPLDNKVYFAGEALDIDGETATVHGAGKSSYAVLAEMLES